jgi:hypothetical protein
MDSTKRAVAAATHRPCCCSVHVVLFSPFVCFPAAAVVVCVHGMVEQLERDEELAELSFFQVERDAIEREFEDKLEQLKRTLLNSSAQGHAGERQTAQASEKRTLESNSKPR